MRWNKGCEIKKKKSSELLRQWAVEMIKYCAQYICMHLKKVLAIKTQSKWICWCGQNIKHNNTYTHTRTHAHTMRSRKTQYYHPKSTHNAKKIWQTFNSNTRSSFSDYKMKLNAFCYKVVLLFIYHRSSSVCIVRYCITREHRTAISSTWKWYNGRK